MRFFLLLQRLFRVPPVPGKNIPYTRVNHNKYMVTDNAAYISELLTNPVIHRDSATLDL